MKMQENHLDCLLRIYQGKGWAFGVSRTGGARARMCEKLIKLGYLNNFSQVSKKGTNAIIARYTLEEING